MSDLDRAAWILAGLTAVFLLFLFAAWRSYRRRPAPAAPKIPKIAREPGESRFSGFARKKEPAVEPVAIAPSRLARVSRAAVERPIEPMPFDDPDPIAGQSTEAEPESADAESADDIADLRRLPDLAPSSLAEDPLPETPAIDEAALDALAAEVERQAHGAGPAPAATGGVRLMPQIPPRDPPIRYRKNVPDCWIELELTEGKNRQVRRMTAAVGFPTLRLIRVAIGGLELSSLGLGSGKWRELNASESSLILGASCRCDAGRFRR